MEDSESQRRRRHPQKKIALRRRGCERGRWKPGQGPLFGAYETSRSRLLGCSHQTVGVMSADGRPRDVDDNSNIQRSNPVCNHVIPSESWEEKTARIIADRFLRHRPHCHRLCRRKGYGECKSIRSSTPRRVWVSTSYTENHHDGHGIFLTPFSFWQTSVIGSPEMRPIVFEACQSVLAIRGLWPTSPSDLQDPIRQYPNGSIRTTTVQRSVYQALSGI